MSNYKQHIRSQTAMAYDNKHHITASTSTSNTSAATHFTH